MDSLRVLLLLSSSIRALLPLSLLRLFTLDNQFTERVLLQDPVLTISHLLTFLGPFRSIPEARLSIIDNPLPWAAECFTHHPNSIILHFLRFFSSHLLTGSSSHTLLLQPFQPIASYILTPTGYNPLHQQRHQAHDQPTPNSTSPIGHPRRAIPRLRSRRPRRCARRCATGRRSRRLGSRRRGRGDSGAVRCIAAAFNAAGRRDVLRRFGGVGGVEC